MKERFKSAESRFRSYFMTESSYEGDTSQHFSYSVWISEPLLNFIGLLFRPQNLSKTAGQF